MTTLDPNAAATTGVLCTDPTCPHAGTPHEHIRSPRVTAADEVIAAIGVDPDAPDDEDDETLDLPDDDEDIDDGFGGEWPDEDDEPADDADDGDATLDIPDDFQLKD